jgi:hypothetical protein
MSRRAREKIEEGLSFGKVGSNDAEMGAIDDAEQYLRVLAMVQEVGVPMSEEEKSLVDTERLKHTRSTKH